MPYSSHQKKDKENNVGGEEVNPPEKNSRQRCSLPSPTSVGDSDWEFRYKSFVVKHYGWLFRSLSGIPISERRWLAERILVDAARHFDPARGTARGLINYVRRVCLRKFHYQGVERQGSPPISLDEISDLPDPETLSPSEMLELADARRLVESAVRAAIAALGEPNATFVRLKYLEELSYEEIWKRVHSQYPLMTPGIIKLRCHRAMKRLWPELRAMGPLEDGPGRVLPSARAPLASRPSANG